MKKMALFMALIFSSCQGSFIPAFAAEAPATEESVCIPIDEANQSVKDLEACQQIKIQLGLAQQEAQDLKTENDNIARDYNAEIDKRKAEAEKSTYDALKKFLYLFGGLVSGFVAGKLAK